MKICFISNLYPPFIMGGGEISVRRTAEGLVKKGHEVLVITTSSFRKRYSKKIDGVKVYRLNFTNIYTPYTSQKQPIITKINSAKRLAEREKIACEIKVGNTGGLG